MKSINPWQQAIDQELICAHLGVANEDVSREEAKKALKELIDWHIAVAIDPVVNGGYKLVKIEPAG